MRDSQVEHKANPNAWFMIPSLEDLADEPPNVRIEIWAAAIALAYRETDQLPFFGSSARAGWAASALGIAPVEGVEEAGWLAREILAEHGEL